LHAILFQAVAGTVKTAENCLKQNSRHFLYMSVLSAEAFAPSSSHKAEYGNARMQEVSCIEGALFCSGCTGKRLGRRLLCPRSRVHALSNVQLCTKRIVDCQWQAVQAGTCWSCPSQARPTYPRRVWLDRSNRTPYIETRSTA